MERLSSPDDLSAVQARPVGQTVSDDEEATSCTSAEADDARERPIIGPPFSREQDTHGSDRKRRESVAEALAQLQELLNQPVNEETRARWFAPEILCALLLLQDHRPDQFGALCERVRSKKIVFMKNLENAMEAHRRGECPVGHAAVAPSAKLLTASQATQLVQLAHAAGVEVFHDAEGRGYATAKVGSHSETWPLGSNGFDNYLRERFYASRGTVPTGLAVRDAVSTLMAEAHGRGAERRVYLRFAHSDGNVYLDLCNEKWEAVEVTAQGWRVISDPPVKFIRTKGMLPLPTPAYGGRSQELRRFVNVASEADFRLIIAFLLVTMMPEGPKVGLAISGQQGSGKDTVQKAIRNLVDPNKAVTRSLPKDTRTLMITAQNSAMLSFGNVSGLPYWLADALCCAMTGAGHSERELYTDTDETLISITRPVMVNGIPDIATRSDLAERMITLVLPEIPRDKRQTERQFWRTFDEARPRILGALCDAAVGALRELPNVQVDELPRMADAAEWVTAAEESLGWPPGTFLADFRANQEIIADVVLEGSPIPEVLNAFVRRCLAELKQQGVEPPDEPDASVKWRGTASDLHKLLLEGLSVDEKRAFPKAANALGTELRRLAPALRGSGIHVTFERAADHGRGRIVRIKAELARFVLPTS